MLRLAGLGRGQRRRAGLLALFVVVAGLLAGAASSLTLERTRLVDYALPDGQHTPQPRYLFRGDVPDWAVDNSHLDPANRTEAALRLGELTGIVARRLAEAGLPVPPQTADRRWAFVVVNLLSNTSAQQRNAIDAEEAFYTSNPELGQLVVWPIVGTPDDPSALSPSTRNATFRNASAWRATDSDRLSLLLPMLHATVHPPLPPQLGGPAEPMEGEGARDSWHATAAARVRRAVFDAANASAIVVYVLPRAE